MGFDEIVLSKDELDLLKALATKGAILVVNDIRDAVRRLEHFGLAQTEIITNPAFIIDIRRDFRRDVLLTFIGAVIGSLVTLLFEHLPLLVELIKSAIQRGGE